MTKNILTKKLKALDFIYTEEIMEKQILTDPMIRPENTVLEDVLGKSYDLYKKFMDAIREKNLSPEWNYYKDGKSWLCKILGKKKTMCWLSVWDTGFKATFYFTQKTIDGVSELKISGSLKETAKETQAAGKLIPIILSMKNRKALLDGIKLLEYKMTLK